MFEAFWTERNIVVTIFAVDRKDTRDSESTKFLTYNSASIDNHWQWIPAKSFTLLPETYVCSCLE